MKAILKGLFLAILLASMCACSGDDAVTSTQVKTSVVNFSFFDASVEEFATRADDADSKSWKKYFKRLDIAIFPVDESKNASVYHVKQLSTDSDYGTLSIRLPIGEYTMVAVASKSDTGVSIESPSLATFLGDAAVDMAYVCQAIHVKSGTTSANCLLKRSLTKMVLQSSDALASNVGKVEITYKGFLSKSFNPTTGYGVKGETEETFSKSFTFADGDKGRTVLLSFYSFIPEDVEQISVGVKVYDVQGEILKELLFDNVKLQLNHVTTYKGPLFTSGSMFDFTFDNVDFKKSDYDVEFGDDVE